MKTVKEIKQILGDRVLVKKLEKPNKIGNFIIPEAYRKNKGRSNIWWGEVEGFGLDSKAQEAWDLKEGDIVGIDVVGDDCLTFKTDDGAEHGWVPDEFIALRDEGDVGEMYSGASR